MATYFNSGPFSQEPIGTFGNVGRALIHGPGYNYSDLSLYKSIPLGGEGARSMQIMMQACERVQPCQLREPDGNFNDGSFFGTVTGVKHRQITTAIRMAEERCNWLLRSASSQ